MTKTHPAAGSPTALHTWSTADVPRAQRFDYFVEALSTALIPMRADSAERTRTQARIDAAEFDGVTVIRQSGTPHWSVRDAHELARSGAHTFHLVANYAAPWSLSHRRHIRLRPGDAVLTDSMIGHELVMDRPYDVIHLKLSEAWARRWMQSPAALVGRRIPADARWGRALTSFIAQLSPHYLLDAPLPARVITDQLGALLALVCAEVAGAATPTNAASLLRARVKDCIHERSAERALTATDIATMLDVPLEDLHACLVPFGETFGALLTGTRLDIAERMLQSASFRSLSADEIARRAGFAGEAEFASALRGRSSRPLAAWRGE